MASYLPGSRPNSLLPFVCRRVSPVLYRALAIAHLETRRNLGFLFAHKCCARVFRSALCWCAACDYATRYAIREWGPEPHRTKAF